MSESVQDGPAIVAGYEWRCRVEVTGATVPFPSGVALTGHVRRRQADTAILATLSTANGGIARVDDTHIDLVLPETASAGWKHDTVTLDIVRTDTTPDQYMGWIMTVPVVQPVTRGLT